MNVGMIFGIIFTLILMGLIFVFGGKQIASMFNIAGDATVYNDINILEKEVANVYSMTQGSSKRLLVHAREDAKVCFINIERSDITENGWDGNMGFVAKNTGYNVMIFKEKGFDGKHIKHLEPQKNFCITESKYLVLVNRGRFVDVVPGA